MSYAPPYAPLEGYLRIGRRLASLCEAQVELDIEAFERSARPLRDAERDGWRRHRIPAMREAFLWSGVVHPRFREVAARHFPGKLPDLDQAAAAWSMAL